MTQPIFVKPPEPTVSQAILSLNPAAKFNCYYADNVDPVTTVTWLDEHEGIRPTADEIRNEQTRLQAIFTRQKVERQRQHAYRTESDGLFFKWQAGEDTEQTWLAARAAVKTKFPYSE